MNTIPLSGGGATRLTSAMTAARLERLPISRWHWKLTAIVGIGAFYEYFEVFLGSVLAAVLTSKWNLSTFETSCLISSMFVGMFIGGVGLSRLADRLGRRRMFLVNLSIYLGFSLIGAFANDVWFLVACRLLSGIGAGAEAALIPTYLGEFLPRHRRGRFIGYAFTFAFLAYPVVALLGAPLAESHFLIDGWRWLMLLGASGVLLLLWMRRNMPESPRWLVSVGRNEEAQGELARIESEVSRAVGGPLPDPDLSLTVDERVHERVRILDLFRGGNARRMIAVGTLWTIGVLGYYGFSALAPTLLLDKGFDIQTSLVYTAIIGIGYPLGALVASSVAERMERRTLCVWTAVGCAAAGLWFGFGTAGWMIVAAGFAIGFISNVHSSSVNMYASEVFPTRLRSTAIGLCYGTGRIFAALVPFLGFAVLETLGGASVLVMSALFFVLTAVVVQVFGPLTTGKVLEEAAETAPETAKA